MKHRSYWLELYSPIDFRPEPWPPTGITLARLRDADHERARHLWIKVGHGFWHDRAEWSDRQWRYHLAGDETFFWTACERGEDLGSFELQREQTEVKLEGFGLLPHWRGCRLGGGLLTAATPTAFALGAKRVWLHTATDDHPHALPNYLARGYRIYRERPLLNPWRPAPHIHP